MANTEINKFKLIFDNAPFGIYTLDAEGVIDSFNPKMVELAGSKSADDVIGLNALTMSSYREAGLDAFFRKGLAGDLFEKEVRYVSQTGGKETWRHYRGIPLFSGGKVTGLLLIVEDITERKALQDELQKYTSQLEVEVAKRAGELVSLEKQYESVVEGSLVGTTVLQDGVFKYVNPMFLKMFGYDLKEEIIGSSWKKIIYKDDVPLVEKTGLEQRMLGLGAAKIFMVRGIKKDGKIIMVEISSSPSIFEGKPAVIGSLSDVTDRVNEEKRNHEHFEEIEKMNKYMVNREFKMAELKEKLRKYEEKCKENK